MSRTYYISMSRVKDFEMSGFMPFKTQSDDYILTDINSNPVDKRFFAVSWVEFQINPVLSHLTLTPLY